MTDNLQQELLALRARLDELERKISSAHSHPDPVTDPVAISPAGLRLDPELPPPPPVDALTVGGNGRPGDIKVLDALGRLKINLDGSSGGISAGGVSATTATIAQDLTVGANGGPDGRVRLEATDTGGMMSLGRVEAVPGTGLTSVLTSIILDGRNPPRIELEGPDAQRIILDGNAGVITAHQINSATAALTGGLSAQSASLGQVWVGASGVPGTLKLGTPGTGSNTVTDTKIVLDGGSGSINAQTANIGHAIDAQAASFGKVEVIGSITALAGNVAASYTNYYGVLNHPTLNIAGAVIAQTADLQSLSVTGGEGISASGLACWGDVSCGAVEATKGDFRQDVRIGTDLLVYGNVTVEGKITSFSADCAEEFDIDQIAEIGPGTVVVVAETGLLTESREAYDKRTVGVVSGAGSYRPAIVLDRRTEANTQSRVPVALLGKVFCKVDARTEPIVPGDLLTSSDLPGYAMRATDPARAAGAILGKALGRLEGATGLVPMLVFPA